MSTSTSPTPIVTAGQVTTEVPKEPAYDSAAMRSLMQMLGRSPAKRGVTKPLFKKAKARAKAKAAKVARRANRGRRIGKSAAKAFKNRAGAPR